MTEVDAAVEHRLDNGGFVKLGACWSQREAEFLYAFAGTPAAADNTIGRLAWLGRRFDEESLALDAFASLPFSVAGGGNLIVGMDYQKVSARTDTARGAIAGRFDLANWDVSGVSRPEVNYSQSQTDDVTRRGLYSQLRLTPLEGLNLIGGARLSWYESSASDGLSGAALSAQKIDAKLTPYLGLTYDLNDSLTVYASHTAMFQPQTALGADGRPIAPREGRQTEFGLKGALDGLTLTAALFDLRDKNRARQLPGETAFTASEAVRVRGLELEASGQVAPDWQLAAGYVWTQTEYLNGPASGAAFSTYTPKHLFKLWAEYDPDTGALAPWSFGLGVTAMSSFSSSVRGVTVNAPGYATFDASLGYAIDERTDLRLNVSNLFDREYYTRVGSTSVFNFYGEPRNATLKLVRRF
ncbi:MAG: TonB-dependent receptor [Tepidimonas taiwanensis]|nr:TonB-dependent receptor [Tepidimonas taiwanensis]